MRIVWSLPVRGERLGGARGDLVRAAGLIAALRAEGHEVTVVEDAARAGAALVVGGYRRLLRRLLPGRLALVLRDLGRVLHARGHGQRVARAAVVSRASLVVETQVGFALSGAHAARLTGLPLILDDCSPSAEEEALGAGLPGLARRVLRAQGVAATAIVASSQEIRRRLVAEGLPADRIRVVPNGVDLEAYDRGDRDATRQALGLEGRIAIGFVGSFQPWHRVDLLVEAFARLADPRALLVLLGDGPCREPAIERARALGIEASVVAPGAIAPGEVPALLLAVDLGVLPGSNDYGHPMKLVEYGAAGLAALAPDLPPVREVVRDGETGLLFPPGDGAALTAALARLAADPELRGRLGAAARREAASRASWRDLAHALLAGLEAGGAPTRSGSTGSQPGAGW